MSDVRLIPYGVRHDGGVGILVDPSTQKPLASVLEVLDTKPDVNSNQNFVGRLVFSVSDGNLFVFSDTPSNMWIGIENQPVSIGEDDPVGSGTAGDLYYATNTTILWLYDGDKWVSVGGMHGASVVWAFYTADGVETLYSTNVTTYPPVDMVQVYVDGEAKYPGTSVTRDYYMVGNNVQLNFTPNSGQSIAIKTITFVRAVRNARFLTNYYTADGSSNEYDVGVVQAAPGQLEVSIDGAVQVPYTGGEAGSYDYRLFTQNVNIVSLNAFGVTITAVTEEPHGFQVGDPVQIYGALQGEYNGSFTVETVDNPTTFTYEATDVPATSPATPAPYLYFGPVRRNDYISFFSPTGIETPLPVGAKIFIRTIENVNAESISGEINTGNNVGTGASVYKEKVGSVLQFRSNKAGDRMEIIQTADELIFNAKSVAISKVTVHTGTPVTLPVSQSDEYIAVRNTSGSSVTVNLGVNHAPSPLLVGRTISVKDEIGNALTFPISILPHASSSIEGGVVGAPYLISANRGGVTLIFDGINWHIKR